METLTCSTTLLVVWDLVALLTIPNSRLVEVIVACSYGTSLLGTSFDDLVVIQLKLTRSRSTLTPVSWPVVSAALQIAVA